MQDINENYYLQREWTIKKVVDKNKYEEIVPNLESVEVVLVHCNLVNNNYQQTSKVSFTFVPINNLDS